MSMVKQPHSHSMIIPWGHDPFLAASGSFIAPSAPNPHIHFLNVRLGRFLPTELVPLGSSSSPYPHPWRLFARFWLIALKLARTLESAPDHITTVSGSCALTRNYWNRPHLWSTDNMFKALKSPRHHPKAAICNPVCKTPGTVFRCI